MIYLVFDSELDFEMWHEQAKIALGLPKTNYNALTGEPEPSKTGTYQYTSISERSTGSKYLAAIDPSIPEDFLVGYLTMTEQEAVSAGYLISAEDE